MTRELKPCGTPAAYQRHLYHHEPACRPCTEAKAAQDFRWRKRKLDPAAETAALFRKLLDLISGECQRAGMLP